MHVKLTDEEDNTDDSSNKGKFEKYINPGSLCIFNMISDEHQCNMQDSEPCNPLCPHMRHQYSCRIRQLNQPISTLLFS